MQSIKKYFPNIVGLGVSVVFLYIGFQSAHVELHRNANGTVNGRITRPLFIGIYNTL